MQAPARGHEAAEHQRPIRMQRGTWRVPALVGAVLALAAAFPGGALAQRSGPATDLTVAVQSNTTVVTVGQQVVFQVTVSTTNPIVPVNTVFVVPVVQPSSAASQLTLLPSPRLPSNVAPWVPGLGDGWTTDFWQPQDSSQFSQEFLLAMTVNPLVADGTHLSVGAQVGFVNGSADQNVVNNFGFIDVTVSNPGPGPGPDPGPGNGPPGPGATPELDSLLLFGSGLSGLGGYAVLRLRARRRHASDSSRTSWQKLSASPDDKPGRTP